MRGEVGFVVCGSVLGLDGFTVVVFPFLCLFLCAWVGPVELLLRDLIVRSCRPVGGGSPYLIVNVGSLTIKKKKKKKTMSSCHDVPSFDGGQQKFLDTSSWVLCLPQCPAMLLSWHALNTSSLQASLGGISKTS